MAAMGPVPMMDGSRPAWAQDTIFAIGLMPRLCASDWLIKTVAAAPSFTPTRNFSFQFQAQTRHLHCSSFITETLKTWGVSCSDGATAVLHETGSEFRHALHVAAVTWKLVHTNLHWTWGRKDNVESMHVENTSTDDMKHLSPFLDGTMMGTISWSKWPAFWAASVLFWDWTANLSCSSLLMFHCLATFSADKHTQM